MSLLAISELQLTTLCMTYRQIKVPEAKLVTDTGKTFLAKKSLLYKLKLSRETDVNKCCI